MQNEKRLYRSRDSLIGGVCAGIATYFDVDPLIVRIFAVVLGLLSVGVAILVYIAMWIALPRQSQSFTPFEVKPKDARSDKYGTVDCSAQSNQSASSYATPAVMAGWRYTQSTYSGSAHVPPEPPVAAAMDGSAVPFARATATATDAGVSGPDIATAPANAPVSDTARQRHSATVCKSTSAALIQGSLAAGTLLLFFVLAFIVSRSVDQIKWWQCWPLLFVILGIVRMVLPGPYGWRLDGFSWGFALFALGSMFLPMSIGLVSWSTLMIMISRQGSILCLAGVVFVIGVILNSPALRLIAAGLFAIFCLVGLALSAAPGVMDTLVFTMPYGREYYLSFFTQTWVSLS